MDGGILSPHNSFFQPQVLYFSTTIIKRSGSFAAFTLITQKTLNGSSLSNKKYTFLSVKRNEGTSIEGPYMGEKKNNIIALPETHRKSDK